MAKSMAEMIDEAYYWEDAMRSEPDYWDDDGDDYDDYDDYEPEDDSDSEVWKTIHEKRAPSGCMLDGKRSFPGSYQEVKVTEKNTKTGEIRTFNYLDGM